MKSIIEEFENWSVDAKGMLRWWFPDASADLEHVAHQLNSFVQAGFGGVEVAMVPQHVDFDPAEYGWGGVRWKEIMKTILKTAPLDFKVDFTITAHWPPALNTIDPNSREAMQELPFTVTKVSPGQRFEIPLPTTRVTDRDGDERKYAPFITTDELVAVSIAKVASVDSDTRVTLDMGSMCGISHMAVKITDPATGEAKFTPAGIPADCEEFGNRERLKDRQYYWEIDLGGTAVDTAPSEGEGVRKGDWLMFAFYRRGTGQTLSGRAMDIVGLEFPMPNRMYAVDYYSSVSTRAITDWWDENLLSDTELYALLKERRGAIFEDSIETSSEFLMWTDGLLDEFKRIAGYDLTPYLPLVASSRGSKIRYTAPEKKERRIRDDYEEVMNKLYIEHHVLGIQNWAHEFGYQYRSQSYGGFIDTSRAAAVADIAEGETLGFSDLLNDRNADKFRDIAGAVHMAGKKFVSSESLAMIMRSYAMTWKDALVIQNRSFASGVNRSVLHGASFDRAHNDCWSEWPGWHAFAESFAESWTDRQPYWPDVRQFSGYLARMQAVLQGGRPQCDVAILKKNWWPGKGSSVLLDNGYNYENISFPHLCLDSAVVREGVFSPDNGSYRAIVLNDVKAISSADAQRLLDLAEAGLPIVIFGQLPCRSFGLGEQENDGNVANVVKKILELPNTAHTAKESELPELLRKLGVLPSVKHRQTGLRYIRRIDSDGTDYYYILNWNNEPVSASISLEGEGGAWLLNPWLGEAFDMNTRSVNGEVPLELDFRANEGKLIAVSKKMLGKRELPAKVNSAAKKIELDNWRLTIHSWGPGADRAHPERALVTEVDFGERPLGEWGKLSVSEQDVKELGVESMSQVSGVAYYRKSVSMDEGVQAYLKLEHGKDMVMDVKVNGVSVEYIDHSDDLVYLGGLLRGGENEIELRLVTPLNNRLIYENPMYLRKMGGPPPELFQEMQTETQDNYDYEDYVEPFPDNPGGDFRNMSYGLISAELLIL